MCAHPKRTNTLSLYSHELLNHQTTWSWSSRHQEADSHRSFNSSLEATRLDVWCEENSRAIRESAEFQINFKPLSPVKAKPQQLSCCDLILFFALSPAFFQCRKTVSCWRERLNYSAKDNQQHSPRKADIPKSLHLLDVVICWTKPRNNN